MVLGFGVCVCRCVCVRESQNQKAILVWRIFFMFFFALNRILISKPALIPKISNDPPD